MQEHLANFLVNGLTEAFLGKISWNAPHCAGMAKKAAQSPDYLDNDAIARRVRTLRFLVVGGGQGAQTHFAVQLGVEIRRWNNYEHGHPLPRDMAVRLVRYIPGLTLDWLYLGRADGLAQKLYRELVEAGKGLTLDEASGDDDPSPSVRKRSTRSRA